MLALKSRLQKGAGRFAGCFSVYPQRLRIDPGRLRQMRPDPG
jgi:hypothetical protein